MQRDPIEISAITLIDKILEFVAMMSYQNDWAISQLTFNSSYEIRYRQINVLIDYFVPELKQTQDFKKRIDYILNGDFIVLRQIALYQDLLNDMDKVIQSSDIKIPRKMDWDTFSLRSNYKNTVEFKQKMRSILIFNHGYMAISYEYLYQIEITNHIINNINTTEIDNFIGKVIDPLGRIISKETLVKDFNYPEEDVYIADLDNW